MSCCKFQVVAGVALVPFFVAFAGAARAADAQGIYTAPMLTPEIALAAAQAALGYCRKAGWQVAVVDRSAMPLVVLSDRYAGFHTLDVGIGKARTAVSFKTPTGQLAERTQAGKPESGIRSTPGGENDERCAERESRPSRTNSFELVI